MIGILTTNNWVPNLWAVRWVGNPNPAAVMLPCPMSGYIEFVIGKSGWTKRENGPSSDLELDDH